MKEQAAAPAEEATAAQQADHIKPPTKLERVLIALLTRGSLNRLEAEKPPVFDHALNSTMSCELGRRLNLTFSSTPEKCIGYSGQSVHYNRYRLLPGSIEPAQKAVNELRLKRGASPVVWPAGADPEQAA
ncbi:hypothetical protein [Marinobacterium stanieri]|uniref:hypothetical protein n=1 Tax=Marinobacterium stanieri TaxID=49186 RepID=UPI000255A0E2|nr:hypothetical protein [Marinobacterium stanieri]